MKYLFCIMIGFLSCSVVVRLDGSMDDSDILFPISLLALNLLALVVNINKEAKTNETN